MINFRTVAKTLLPVIFVLSVCLVKAETASYDDVQKVARNFMKRSFDRTDSIVEVVKFDTLDITTMYAFNFEKGGYVLVSGSYNADPILAYSNSDKFLPKDSINNEGVLEFLDDCKKIILGIEKSSDETRSVSDSESGRKWKEWFSEREKIYAMAEEEDILEVKDLLYDSLRGGNVKWNQNGCEGEKATYYDKNLEKWVVTNNPNNISYNIKMPPVENCKEHGYAGCIPVAIGQVMWKWKWPQFVSYNHIEKEGDKKIEKKYTSEYTWDSMPARLSVSSSIRNMNEISTLLRDCGYMLDADYYCSGTATRTSDVCDIMIRKNLIDYNCYGVIYTDSCTNRSWNDTKNTYSISDWTKLIVTELIAGRPVVVGSTYWITENMYNGHGFVVSGYQKKVDGYYFYINYGWSGHYDSYYNMDFTATPKDKGERYAYTKDKEAIIGISPKKENETGEHNIVAECHTSTISEEGIGKLSFYVKNSNSYIVKIKYKSKEIKSYRKNTVGIEVKYSDCKYKDIDVIISRTSGNIFKDGFIELWYGENVKLQNKCELLCDTISVPTEYEVTFINNYGQVETYNGIFVKPDSIITANEDNSIDGVISIYPNPTTGIFNVESYQDNIENILVSNITGMKIKEIDKIKATHFAINLFDFPAGCYFVTVKTENSSIVKKIIKK